MKRLMQGFIRWLLADPSEAGPRDLPDFKTRVERGITSLLAITSSENDS